MLVEGLVPPNLSSVTLSSSQQCLQVERFHQQHIQMVNITSGFKRKLVGN